MQIGTYLPEEHGSGGTRHTRRLVVAALVLAAGLVAVTSSLGAIDRPGLGPGASPGVGPGNSVLAACDADGVRASFTAEWDATDGRYEIRALTVSGVSDACDGQRMEVALTGSGDTEIGTASIAIPSSEATSFEVSLANAPSAESTEDVHIILGS